MKVVHVVEPLDTGINTFIQELVNGIPECDHVVIHGIRANSRSIDEMKNEYTGNVKFIRWTHAQREISFLKDFRAFIELFNLLRKESFDVLHLHSSKASILGRLVAFFCRYQHVIYTPNAASFLRTDISHRKKKFFIRLEKIAAKLPGKIISSSKSEHKAFKSINISTKIIQNGVAIETPKSIQKNGKIKVITCGKITTQKDPNLFNRIAMFFTDNPEIQFIWVGDGEMRAALTSPNISITGWCKKEDVMHFLASADIYLSTSKWEGLSLAVIEAMASGLPLILSSCPGNIDLVINGVNGYDFHTKEQAIELIESLRTDRDKLSAYGQRSSKMYRHHYGDFRCAREYFGLYNAVKRKMNT